MIRHPRAFNSPPSKRALGNLLLLAIAQGKEASFQRLFGKYGKPVVRLRAAGTRLHVQGGR